MAARGAAELRWATERRRSDSGASRACACVVSGFKPQSLLCELPQLLLVCAAVLRPCGAESCRVASWQLRYTSLREQWRVEKVELRASYCYLPRAQPLTSSQRAVQKR